MRILILAIILFIAACDTGRPGPAQVPATSPTTTAETTLTETPVATPDRGAQPTAILVQLPTRSPWSTTIILAALRQLLWPLGVRCNCRL